MTIRSTSRALRHALTGEAGLTLYEVLVAILVLAVGLMGVYASLGTSNGAIAAGERQAAMAQVGQQTLQSVELLPYASIANSSEPVQTSTTDATNPTYYLTSCGSSSCSYYWSLNRSGTAEQIAYDSTNGKVAPGPTTVVVPDPNATTCASTNTSKCRIVLSVYTFVTNVTSAEDSACSTTSCYKRVTVAVKNAGKGPPYNPVYVSSFVDPKGGGSSNPLTSSSTQCLDGTTTVVCTH